MLLTRTVHFGDFTCKKHNKCEFRQKIIPTPVPVLQAAGKYTSADCSVMSDSLCCVQVTISHVLTVP